MTDISIQSEPTFAMHSRDRGVCSDIINHDPDRLAKVWERSRSRESEVGLVYYSGEHPENPNRTKLQYSKSLFGEENSISTDTFDVLIDSKPRWTERIYFVHTHPTGFPLLSTGDIQSSLSRIGSGDTEVAGYFVLTNPTLQIEETEDNLSTKRSLLEKSKKYRKMRDENLSESRKKIARKYDSYDVGKDRVSRELRQLENMLESFGVSDGDLTLTGFTVSDTIMERGIPDLDLLKYTILVNGVGESITFFNSNHSSTMTRYDMRSILIEELQEYYNYCHGVIEGGAN